MATVNFSVPDDVKAAFDKTFAGQNKSAVLADLMRRAVEESDLRRRREQLFKKLTDSKPQRSLVTSKQIAAARRAGRS